MEENNHMQVESAENKPNRKVQKTVLDNFAKLINPHDNVRVRSSVNLLKHLIEKNVENGANESKYAIKRLVRGLGSSTSNARAGFYTTLVGLLSTKDDIVVDDILENISSELHRSAKNTDGENADICTGQILGCGAIISSSLWARTSEENKKKTLEVLLNASKERIYLKLPAFVFIQKLCNEINEEEFKQIVLPIIKPEILKPWSEQNLDSLYLLLHITSKYQKAITKKELKNTLNNVEILSVDDLVSVSSVLMTIPRISSIRHPIYDLIVKQIPQNNLVQLFEALDQHLKSANRNRLLVFIKLLTNVCQYIPTQSDVDLSLLPKLLAHNFIQQMINYFKTFKGKSKDLDFQEQMKKLFETILQALQHESVQSKTSIGVLKRFLFYPGTFIFEKVTKSKIIQQITGILNSKGVRKLADVYRGVVEGTEKIDSENADNEIWLNNDRLYSAHLLIKLLNHQAMKNENEWKIEQLIFLMKLGLLKESCVGRELSESLKSAFFGALDLKLSKLEDLQTILIQLVRTLDTLINEENLETTLRNPLTPEAYNTWRKTVDLIEKIDKKKKKRGLNSVFLTLFLHMGLQLFNDVKLATESLNELFLCYDRVKKDKKCKSILDESANNITVNADEKDPLWIEVVTDLFLNLLSHNSHLLRNIIKCVFPHLCEYMTATSVHQILSVLDPKNDDNPLSKRNESSDDESESENEENPEESDGDDEDQEESSEDEEDDVEDESTNTQLRMALHQALTKNGHNSDDESVDLDNMSDTEAEKLDEALADAFRQFKPNLGRRRKQTRDQESLTHFRTRVLDLIEIYLDSTPSMILALEIMLPLLQAVEFSIRDQHQKPLNDRLKSCLKKLSALKKFSDTEGISGPFLADLLKSLLEKGTKNAFMIQEMGEQMSDCCVFVIKCSENLRTIESTPKKTKKQLKNSINEVILQELKNYFMKRDCLTPYVLFKSLLQVPWDGKLELVTELLGFIFSDEVKPYKKSQAAELLKIFYSNQRYLSQDPEKIGEKLSEHQQTFSQAAISFFKQLCEDPEVKNVKEKFICNLFTLLSSIKSCPLRTDNMSWSDIGENVREYRSYKTFSKDAKLAYNKLCKNLGIQNTVQMKSRTTKLNNVNEENEANEVVSKNDKTKQKKNKKLDKEKQKLKKEAKALRLQSLSEGFSNSLDFTSAKEIKSTEAGDDHNRMSESGEDEEMQDKENKKKHTVNGKTKNNTAKRKNTDVQHVPKKKKKNL